MPCCWLTGLLAGSGLPVNDGTITLTRSGPQSWPSHVETGDGTVTVFDPARPVHWAVTPDS